MKPPKSPRRRAASARMLDVSTGSIQDAEKTHNLAAAALVGVIVVCAVILGVERPSTPWTVGLSVASAVTGALLGNVVRLDLSQNIYRVQARPATRHLFDQVQRTRALVIRVEGYGAMCRTEDISNERTADWFASVGNELRSEIEATATAIDNWSDLAADVRDEEWGKYLNRNSRLPGHEGPTND